MANMRNHSVCLACAPYLLCDQKDEAAESPTVGNSGTIVNDATLRLTVPDGEEEDAVAAVPKADRRSIG